MTKKDFGITKDYYFNYFVGKVHGFALKIKKARLYKQSYSIQDRYGLVPPQSFAYLRE